MIHGSQPQTAAGTLYNAIHNRHPGSWNANSTSDQADPSLVDLPAGLKAVLDYQRSPCCCLYNPLMLLMRFFAKETFETDLYLILPHFIIL